VLAVDPNRSNGVPLNPWFRNPTPGSNDPLQYDDPVTTPAGDIADNPYWKRDARRSYARTSVLGQADAVALLSVGSAASPKRELVGEEGGKALVAAQEEGRSVGLASYLMGDGGEGKELAERGRALLTRDGLPPLPAGAARQEGDKWDVHAYERTEDAYSDECVGLAFCLVVLADTVTGILADPSDDEGWGGLYVHMGRTADRRLDEASWTPKPYTPLLVLCCLFSSTERAMPAGARLKPPRQPGRYVSAPAPCLRCSRLRALAHLQRPAP
jgi:hypothetical protein